MQMFVDVDAEGRVRGFYPRNHPARPDGAVEISEADWRTWAFAANQGDYRWQGGGLVHVGPSLAEAKAVRRAAVNDERRRRQALGVSYTFPDGVVGTIDTRNHDDASNILGLYGAAQALMDTAPDTVFASFRDAEDQDHPLSPKQMLALFLVVVEHRTALFQRSWVLKDTITAATTVAAVEAVDVTADWPTSPLLGTPPRLVEAVDVTADGPT